MKLASAKGGPWELYDLSRDRSELNDLAKERPDQANELRELWHQVAENIEHAPANLRREIGSKSEASKNESSKKKN